MKLSSEERNTKMADSLSLNIRAVVYNCLMVTVLWAVVSCNKTLLSPSSPKRLPLKSPVGSSLSPSAVISTTIKPMPPPEPGFTVQGFPQAGVHQYTIDDSQSVRQTVLEVTDFLCGKSYLCNSGGLWVDDEDSDCFACQFPCSCEEECHLYGDCCADRVYNSSDSPTQPKTTCVVVGDISAYMITGCPITESDDYPDLDLCHDPDTSQISQATPVSVVKAQSTYRNQFCALCNGHSEDEMESWTPIIMCSSNITSTSSAGPVELWGLAQKFSGQCSVSFLPPAEVTPSYCQEGIVETCTNNHGVARTICEHFANPVIHNDIIYKNIFCAVCNGVALDKNSLCLPSRELDTEDDDDDVTPRPLSAFINFDPVFDPEIDYTEPERNRLCGIDKVFDPFGDKCVSPQCPVRRIFIRGQCEPVFTTAKGLGFSVFYIMKPTHGIHSWDLLTADYEALVRKILQPLHPYLIRRMGFHIFTATDSSTDEETFEGASVTVDILVMQDIPLRDAEEILQNLQMLSWAFKGDDQNTLITSAPRRCSNHREDIKFDNVREEFIQDSFDAIYGQCDETCAAYIEYSAVEDSLKCPFIEIDIMKSNLRYIQENSTLVSETDGLILNDSTLAVCQDTIKICISALEGVQRLEPEPIPVENTTHVEYKPVESVTLTITSTVCITLSLAALLFTFLIHCYLPELRTFPGKNNMIIIFHLFFAQLLFLSGIGATGSIGVCRTMGILIHYFWMASFFWLTACANSIYNDCLRLLDNNQDPFDERSVVIRNVLMANGLPALTILVCITYHLANSEGLEIGYGESICFLSKLGDIGLYFGGPLGLALAYNVYCFIRTVGTVKKMPDTVQVSNKPKKALAMVYFKLAILLSVAWAFGSFATVFESDILWYFFVVLTAAQGVFVFVSFCVKGHTWEMLKVKVKQLAPLKQAMSQTTNGTTQQTMSSSV